ncbi:hypothetical protein THAOC_10832, partial [Thalassiosira oceanica]
IFANGDDSLADAIKVGLRLRGISGSYVLNKQSQAVNMILGHCTDVDASCTKGQLPIALARTVLQVFIFNLLPELQQANAGLAAVAILDDDKRLGQGWSPFSGRRACIQIGRDCRTPPNPSLFSLRTNLIDLLHSLDLLHSQDGSANDFCIASEHYESRDTFDWYYDMSTSNYSHLELPVYSELAVSREPEPAMDGSFANDDASGEKGVNKLRDYDKLYRDFLIGTPLCRDVIPPLEGGRTSQRGGCMVLIDDFTPLAVQQHAPLIRFSDGSTSYTRRSDSLWCQVLASAGHVVEVNPRLFCYHDNRFDAISSPENIRKNIVQEVLGGILCREPKLRDRYKRMRLIQLEFWLHRVNGLLASLRNRPYFTEQMDEQLLQPLEKILNINKWRDEVFRVLQSNYRNLENFRPRPTNFSSPLASIDLNEDIRIIQLLWNSDRVEMARDVLTEVVGKRALIPVGIGQEGVSFELDGRLYKVFDQGDEDLPASATIAQLGCRYVGSQGGVPVLVRDMYCGTHYKGGKTLAMIALLREWMNMSLYHRNVTPQNIINGVDGVLRIVDIGRDVVCEQSRAAYLPHFVDMCKRAFLCHQFGSFADNPRKMLLLKERMREDLTSIHLVGFDAFMTLLDNPFPLQSLQGAVQNPDQFRAALRGLGADTYCVVSACGPEAQYIDCLQDDNQLLESIWNWANGAAARNQCGAVVIRDPFRGNDHRPLWFYMRHLRRISRHLCCLLTEESLPVVGDEAQLFVGHYIFLLKFQLAALIESPLELFRPSAGCHLLIKSCPLEFQTIQRDVRRIVMAFERSGCVFRSITLLADLSKTDSFIRPYTQYVDIKTYMKALDLIEGEKLVDALVKFDGSNAVQLNQSWLGLDCISTHSLSGQQYASTFHAFESIRGLDVYKENDTILQMDSDVIIHCRSDIIGESMRALSAPQTITLAFPTLSTSKSTVGPKADGSQFRFEIRCSFIHLERLISMLPLKVEHDEIGMNGVIRQGWWHILDANIKKHELASLRGSLGGGTSYFIHPENELKVASKTQALGLVSDLVSMCTTYTDGWTAQLDNVNLVSLSIDWMSGLHEQPVVVAVELTNATYASGRMSLDYIRRLKQSARMFSNCGVILISSWVNSDNEDLTSMLFATATELFGDEHVSLLRTYGSLGTSELHHYLWTVCEEGPIIFIQKGSQVFDLKSTRCLLPRAEFEFCSNFCNSCGFYDERCSCEELDPLEGIPSTALPVVFRSLHDGRKIHLEKCTFFANETVSEGALDIKISAQVNLCARIRGCEDVAVRIHSECLTGDIFGSAKCDCGDEKTKFFEIMAEEEARKRPSVFVYIQGHEGRGAGLCRKVSAYSYSDRFPNSTHIEALRAVGFPESDVREYDAAVSFLKKLGIKSIKVYTNNPKKMESVKMAFPNKAKFLPMPAIPTKHNRKYLKEKVALSGHMGLLKRANKPKR